MISIKLKQDCCGCSACAQICPNRCVTMTSDEEGFLYPQVDERKCVDCGLCETVCPVINRYEPQMPIESIAAFNQDEKIRLSSSSGGVFSLLAENTINAGGVVFGAKFNENWAVEHGHAETVEELADFRGSKYVQSYIGDCYNQAKDFLDAGRKVLFSGTPCQIAGLKRFLRKGYPNLLAVDIICHGVPSPLVWGKYLNDIKARLGEIEYITFRGKLRGWKNYCFCALKKVVDDDALSTGEDPEWGVYSPYRSNDYSKAFLQNYSLRPSCYSCPAKSGKSHSDITIADFWGIQHIHPDFDDDKGCNLVLINSAKGFDAFNSCHCKKLHTETAEALKYNPSFSNVLLVPKYRELFFSLIKEKDLKTIMDIIHCKCQPSLLRRAVNKCKRGIRIIVGGKAINALKKIIR